MIEWNKSISDGNRWFYGTFDIFKNFQLSVFTFVCPCLVFGSINDALGEDRLLCCFLYCTCCFGCYAHFRIRGAIRQKKRIMVSRKLYFIFLFLFFFFQGDWKSDCAYAYFCGPCSLIQEAREIEESQSKIERN